MHQMRWAYYFDSTACRDFDVVAVVVILVDCVLNYAHTKDVRRPNKEEGARARLLAHTHTHTHACAQTKRQQTTDVQSSAIISEHKKITMSNGKWLKLLWRVPPFVLMLFHCLFALQIAFLFDANSVADIADVDPCRKLSFSMTLFMHSRASQMNNCTIEASATWIQNQIRKRHSPSGKTCRILRYEVVSRITDALSSCCVITGGKGNNFPSSLNSIFSFSRRLRAAFLLFSFISSRVCGSVELHCVVQTESEKKWKKKNKQKKNVKINKNE